MLRVCLNWSSTASLEGRIFNKGSYATFWWLAHQLWIFHTRQNWAEKNTKATQNNTEMDNCHHFTWLFEIRFYSSNQPRDLTDPEWRSKGSFQISIQLKGRPTKQTVEIHVGVHVHLGFFLMAHSPTGGPWGAQKGFKEGKNRQLMDLQGWLVCSSSPLEPCCGTVHSEQKQVKWMNL